MKKVTIILILSLAFFTSGAQMQIIPEDTDHVYCHVSGKTLSPVQASINTTPISTFPSSLVVTCGIFRIYYEDFISNPNEGFADPVLGAARRNTYCAVLNYIQSTFDLNWNGQIYDIYVEKSYSASNPVPVNYPSLATAGPYFLPNTYGVIPGYFGGEFYDHYQTGSDPDVNEYDGHMLVNFDQVYPNSIPTPVNYWDNYLVTTPPCNYDLYTVFLHEMMHMMGWFSAVGESGGPNFTLIVTSNNSNIQSFSKLDEKFLWSGDVRFAPGSFVNRKLVVPTSATTGMLNPLLTTVPNILRNFQTWMTNTVSPNNYKAYDGETPGAYNQGASVVPGSFLSHLDMDQWSFYRGAQHSPGYQPEYVISPVLYTNEKKRTFTMPELRCMKTLGYNYNPTFASATNLSTLGNIGNQTLLNTNTPPTRNNIATTNLVFWPYNTFPTFVAATEFSETRPADYTITNFNTPAGPTNATNFTIDVHTFTNTADANGDLIGILPNSLYGIRGVTTGGNNHNAIVQTNSHTVVYTPPPGYIGRAEFAFQLWDGYEAGARKLITIDVNPGFLPILPGNELIINGTHEDATEVKTLSNLNSPQSAYPIQPNMLSNELNLSFLYHGASPFGHLVDVFVPFAGGIKKRETLQACHPNPALTVFNNPPNINGINFGGIYNTFGSSLPPTVFSYLLPERFPNLPNNECYSFGSTFLNYTRVYTSMNLLQKCKFYQIELDITNVGGNVANGPYTFSLFVTPTLAPDPNQPGAIINPQQVVPITFNKTANSFNALNTNWQHITASFVYCGNPSRYIVLEPGQSFAIDNISLKELTTPPPPLVVTAVNSSTLFCPGSSATLTAVAANTLCSISYTWLPMNVNTPTVAVTPTSATQSYTLLVNDGCRTGSSVVTATPSPAGTFTVPSPLCQSQALTNLAQYTSAFPSGGVFSGPGVFFNSPQYIFDPSSIAAGTYTILYTVTNPTTNCQSIYPATVSVWPQPTVSIANSNSCATLGQTVNLVANSSGTIPLTYTWQPGGSSSSSIAVSPSVTTVYTLIATNGSCTSVLTTTVNAFTPITFTNLPTGPWCTFQTLGCLENYLAPPTPTPGFWTGPGTFTSSNGCTMVYLSPTITPGTYTFVYSYPPRAGGAATSCTVSNQFTINIVPGFSLSVVSPTVTYCANIAVGASVQAIANPSTSVNYTWLPGPINSSSFVATPASNTIYSLTASNGPCSFTNQVAVNVSTDCCQSTNNTYVSGNSVTNQTLIGLYAINQDITINGSVVFGGEFLVAKNVSITVVPGATLTSYWNTGGVVPSPVHMRSCGDMWSGIYVQNGGKNIFFNGDLIEDALDGIVSDGCTSISGFDIDMQGVAFNRNNFSIQIKNYNQTTGSPPFKINNCVFTCRDLQIPLNSLTWPSAAQLFAISGPTNTLASPYLVGAFTPTNCKAPFTNRASLGGVFVQNSGLTANPTSTSPTYFSINIADPTFPSQNLFDNQIMSLWAFNSNINSYANIFQNTKRLQLTPTVFTGGYGIYGSNNNAGPNQNTRVNLVHPITPTASPNIFYDCHIAVGGMNLFELNCQYQDFRSTQSSAVTFNNNLRGQYGIWCISNRIKTYTITNNVFQNVRTGVRVGMINGALNLPSIPNYGTYLGKTTISNNLFSPTIGTIAPVGNGFIYYGVYVDAALNPAFNTFYASGASLQIITNNFSRVYRACFVSNSSNKFYTAFTANNRISMISDANTPTAFQYGIQHLYNYGDVVNTNTIIGVTSTLNDPRVAGVYRSANTLGSTQCNSVVSVYAGFHFAGTNTGAFWRYNFMNTNRRGLQMTSNAIISQQGTFNSPSDNLWQVTSNWTGINKGTWTDNSTFPVNSPLAVRTLPVTNFPPNNANQSNLNPQTYFFGAGTIIFANNNAPSSSPCPSSGGPCPTCNPNLVATMNDIVTNNVTYSVATLETDEINKGLVFRDVTLDPTLMDSSTVLSNFYAANTASTLGAINNVQTNQAQGNLNLSAAILAAMNPNSNIENNNKIFYNIYNNYLQNNTLGVADRLALFILAHQCPFTDGPIVYQARALHSIVTEEVKPYNDNACEDRGFSRSPSDSSSNSFNGSDKEIENLLANNEKKTEAMFKRISLYDIYPNPANDYFSIISNVRSEKLELKITDVSGKILAKKNIVTYNYSADLTVDLINGIYFVNLVNERGQRTTKKLVISKD